MIIYLFYFKVEGVLQPIKSVCGEYLAFDSHKNARELLREWKTQGEVRVYGYDTFFVSDVRIKKLI